MGSCLSILALSPSHPGLNLGVASDPSCPASWVPLWPPLCWSEPPVPTWPLCCPCPRFSALPTAVPKSQVCANLHPTPTHALPPRVHLFQVKSRQKTPSVALIVLRGSHHNTLRALGLPRDLLALASGRLSSSCTSPRDHFSVLGANLRFLLGLPTAFPLLGWRSLCWGGVPSAGAVPPS